MATPAGPARASDAHALEQEAAEWVVRLTADDAAERAEARAGLEAWKARDPRHAEAAAAMERMVAQLQSMRTGAPATTQPARAALDAALGDARTRTRRGNRSGAIKRLAAVAVLAVCVRVAWVAWPGNPLAVVAADVSVPAGQQMTHVLSDGSRVLLDAAAAFNVRVDTSGRHIDLLRGDILVDVARDAARPFVVETTHGRVQALGTRFIVSRQAKATILTMLESRTSVRALESPAATDVVVKAGQRVHIHADAISAPEGVDATALETAWTHRRLVVQDWPLTQVLDELERHRPGLVLQDRAALSGLRVSAVLPLDDLDASLTLLQRSFAGLRVRRPAPWLIWVDRVAPG